DLDDLAHRLVADDVALLHGRHEAVVQVQVAAADGGRGDPDDAVGRVGDLRVGDVIDADVAGAVPAYRFHDFSLDRGSVRERMGVRSPFQFGGGGQLHGGEDVEGGDAGHGGGGAQGVAASAGVGVAHRHAEGGQVEHVAGDPRPQPAGRRPLAGK